MPPRTLLIPKSPLAVQFDDASSDGNSDIDQLLTDSSPRRYLKKSVSQNKISSTRALSDFLRNTGPEDLNSSSNLISPSKSNLFSQKLPSQNKLLFPKRDHSIPSPSLRSQGINSISRQTSSNSLSNSLSTSTSNTNSNSTSFWRRQKLTSIFTRKQDSSDTLPVDDTIHRIDPAEGKLAQLFPNAQIITSVSGKRYTALEIDYNDCLTTGLNFPSPPSNSTSTGYIASPQAMLPPIITRDPGPFIPERRASRSFTADLSHSSNIITHSNVNTLNPNSANIQKDRKHFDRLLSPNGIITKSSQTVTSGLSNNLNKPINGQVKRLEIPNSTFNSNSSNDAPIIDAVRPLSLNIFDDLVVINELMRDDDSAISTSGISTPTSQITPTTLFTTTSTQITTPVSDVTSSIPPPVPAKPTGTNIAPLKIEKKICVEKTIIDEIKPTRRFSTRLSKNRPPTHLIVEADKLEEYLARYTTNEDSLKNLSMNNNTNGTKLLRSQTSLSNCLPTEEELTDLALKQRLGTFSKVNRRDSESIDEKTLYNNESRKGSLPDTDRIREKISNELFERLEKLLDTKETITEIENKNKKPTRRNVQVQTSPILMTTSFSQTDEDDPFSDEIEGISSINSSTTVTIGMNTIAPLGILLSNNNNESFSPIKENKSFLSKNRSISPPPKQSLPSIPTSSPPPSHAHSSSVSSTTQTPPITPIGLPNDVRDVMYDSRESFEPLVSKSGGEERREENVVTPRNTQTRLNSPTSSFTQIRSQTPLTESTSLFPTDNFDEVSQNDLFRERQDSKFSLSEERPIDSDLPNAGTVLDSHQLLRLVAQLRMQVNQEQRAKQRLQSAYEDSKEKYERLCQKAFMTIQGLVKQRTLLFEEVMSLKDQS